MSVKTEKVEQEKEQVVDDMAEHVVVSEPDSDGVEEDKMAKLKAMMAAKNEDLEEEEVPPQIVQRKRKTLDLGVVGSGQAGSRLAQSLYELGYPALAFNTAETDLEPIKIPKDNKYLFDYGLGGAGKDRTLGLQAAEAHKDMVRSAVLDKLGDSHVFVFCTSLGGGSGSDCIDAMIDVLASLGKPVVVITVLPMTNEDAALKKNALEALSSLTKEVQNKKIHNLIVVDNAKIETIFSDVSVGEFFKLSNEAIVEPLDVFNTFSSEVSEQKGLDQMEFTKILINGGGLSLYGSMSVSNYEEDTALAEAVVTNLNSGLLAGGFDLKQTKYVGAMFLANEKVWSELPQSSINYAMAMVQDHAGTPEGVFKGMYTADIKEDVVKVYSFFSGLALPKTRVEELKVEVASHAEKLKSKDENRVVDLTIDTESQSVSEAEKLKERLVKKNSAFSQFTQGLVNKRRK